MNLKSFGFGDKSVNLSKISKDKYKKASERNISIISINNELESAEKAVKKQKKKTSSSKNIPIHNQVVTEVTSAREISNLNTRNSIRSPKRSAILDDVYGRNKRKKKGEQNHNGKKGKVGGRDVRNFLVSMSSRKERVSKRQKLTQKYKKNFESVLVPVLAHFERKKKSEELNSERFRSSSNDREDAFQRDLNLD